MLVSILKRVTQRARNKSTACGSVNAAKLTKSACDQAATDPDVVCITPAMILGSGLKTFSDRFPARTHDVGICEQHAATLAAGMACTGERPVLALYSTFAQRTYDQLVHDIALQKHADTALYRQGWHRGSGRSDARG